MSSLAWQQIEEKGGALARCLIPLLDGLGWRGDRSRLIQAVSIGETVMTCEDLIETLRNLGFSSTVVKAAPYEIESRILPVLLLGKKGPAVLLRRGDDEMLVYNGEKARYNAEVPSREIVPVIVFTPAKQQDLASRQKDWFRIAVGYLKPMLFGAALITLVLNLLSLVLPSFISSIYKQLMGGGTTGSIGMLAIGMLIFVAATGALRLLRSLILNSAGARTGFAIGREIFRRLLYFPLSATSSASVSSQIARVRDFDSIRDFIAGPPLVALFETAFSVVVIVGIAVIAGPLAIIPVVTIVLYVAVALFLIPQVKYRNQLAAESVSMRQELLIELLSRMNDLKAAGATSQMQKRYADVTGDAIWAGYKSSQLTAAIHAFSQMVMTLAGLATISWGVLLVIDNTINAGVLMAVLLLVWRVLMPIQSGFGVLTGIEKISGSIRQINRFMTLDFEQRPDSRVVVPRTRAASIVIQQVSVRYIPEAQPALLGVSFTAAPGDIVAITGHSGSGKSTVLSVIAGLVPPQSGRVIIDEKNLLQIDPVQYREKISFLQDRVNLFPGTILNNLLMAYPGATRQDLDNALECSGLALQLKEIDGGLEHVIKSELDLPEKIVRSVALARMIIRPASVVLIDNVEYAGDEQMMISLLNKLRERSTIIVVTGSRSILAAANKIITLDQGRVVAGKSTSVPDNH